MQELMLCKIVQTYDKDKIKQSKVILKIQETTDEVGYFYKIERWRNTGEAACWQNCNWSLITPNELNAIANLIEESKSVVDWQKEHEVAF